MIVIHVCCYCTMYSNDILIYHKHWKINFACPSSTFHKLVTERPRCNEKCPFGIVAKRAS
ncbi:hypothetical protein ACFPFV_01610 [Salinicoccus siamensis]|uniref:hypothetical protein n=1 Tax=Salinicoccus siamensis TaxID=381830 RepID=UPI00361DED03